MSQPSSGSFWLCHECHAEMRPIQRQGVPHCASCDGEFIEILDPDVNTHPFSPPDEEPDHSGFFQTMFSSLLSAANDGGSASTTDGPAAASGSRPRGREFSFNFPGGGHGSVVFGSIGGQPQGEGLDAFFPGFGLPPGEMGGRGQGQDMLGGLFQLLAQEGNLPPGMANTGALGDYVMTENGFDQIMEQLMHAAGPQGPLPATEAVIEGLPKFTFDAKTLESSVYKDCPVCKDDYAPGDEVMRVPCAHVFHPDCLQPWLRTNGSCPVCRFSLVPDEANRPAPEPQAETTAQGQPLLTNILNRLWGQGGRPVTPATETPAAPRSDPVQAAAADDTDPPVPSLSSAIPDDYRERHRQRERERDRDRDGEGEREREREREYPSYFS